MPVASTALIAPTKTPAPWSLKKSPTLTPPSGGGGVRRIPLGVLLVGVGGILGVLLEAMLEGVAGRCGVPLGAMLEGVAEARGIRLEPVKKRSDGHLIQATASARPTAAAIPTIRFISPHELPRMSREPRSQAAYASYATVSSDLAGDAQSRSK
jgi:hypothetical protein